MIYVKMLSVSQFTWHRRGFCSFGKGTPEAAQRNAKEPQQTVCPVGNPLKGSNVERHFDSGGQEEEEEWPKEQRRILPNRIFIGYCVRLDKLTGHSPTLFIKDWMLRWAGTFARGATTMPGTIFVVAMCHWWAIIVQSAIDPVAVTYAIIIIGGGGIMFIPGADCVGYFALGAFLLLPMVSVLLIPQFPSFFLVFFQVFFHLHFRVLGWHHCGY
jgi:hypothetical protein